MRRHGNFQPMLRRLIRLFAGLYMVLMAPALALAHGHAHTELVEHSHESHHRGDGSDTGSELTSPSENDGHAHPTVDPGVFSRLSHVLPVAPPTVPALELVLLRDGSASHRPAPFESPPEPLRTRPQQPRAPPLL
jgi:hypothetical protein